MTREEEFDKYLQERNIRKGSLEENSIREGADWQMAYDDRDLEIVKDTYHKAGYEYAIEKACDAFCKAKCGKLVSGCGECGAYKVFKKAIEK